jgi:hypothetical protein
MSQKELFEQVQTQLGVIMKVLEALGLINSALLPQILFMVQLLKSDL